MRTSSFRHFRYPGRTAILARCERHPIVLSVTFFLLTGLVALLAGGTALVRGASALATRTGIPPLLVGLTVVAFGTSAP
ncbi:MAG: hypothetical protein EP301_06920 [Gammaproteobacteria bacterium]|nr:MAG: hypothetical protein EP301_06920 [Gammaproteobacteria bacterium]